jgi:hypothetical protein
MFDPEPESMSVLVGHCRKKINCANPKFASMVNYHNSTKYQGRLTSSESGQPCHLTAVDSVEKRCLLEEVLRNIFLHVLNVEGNGTY